MHAAQTYAMPQSTTHPDRFVDDRATADERTYTIFQHLVGMANMVSGVPLIGLIATLIMWQVKKSQSPYLDDHGREAMNFQISLLIYTIAGSIVIAILGVITLGVGLLLFPLGGVFLIVIQLIGCIRGAMAANRGEYYRYPMTIRVLPDKAVA
ncbi:MAG: DUF4870 domain-containing protein [Phycisphaerales bacterium]|nr:DUF4870 domain-containing protein [Phycisphaerales bacterium]